MSELTAIEKSIVKDYGNVMFPASMIEEHKRENISIGPKLDYALSGGIPEGSRVIISGPPKCGKEQPIYSKVYTPTGPVEIGSIKVGDIVSTPNGKTAKVIGVYPQGKKDVYEITFNDGSKARCGIEHLWRLKRNDRSLDNFVTLPLKDFIKDYKYSDRDKWCVQLTKEVYFNKQEVKLDPYLLGCLLGDGSFRYRYGKGVDFTNADLELLNSVDSILQKYNCYLKKYAKYGYAVKSKSADNYINLIIKYFGLNNLKSGDKFIPKEYIYNSVHIRKEIIRGLLDTDGYNRLGKGIEYSTKSKHLKDSVVEICKSLGYTAISNKRITYFNKKPFDSYRIAISGDNISDLFSLSRKKYGKRKKNPKFRTISKIRKVDYCESVCIELDDSDQLYLTDDYIVTHNTTTTLQIAANAMKIGRKVFYYDVEHRFKLLNLYGINGFDKDKMVIIRSNEERQLSAEDFLEIAKRLMKAKENKGSIHILDSVSALCTENIMTSGDVSSTRRASVPKLFKDFMNQVAGTIPIMNITFIAIQHLIANTSGYGLAENEDGGRNMQYQADIKIRGGSPKMWEEDEKIIGIIATWNVIWSALGAPAGKIESYIRFNYGIDDVAELCELCTDFGIIKKGGAWYDLSEHGIPSKIQGQPNLIQALHNNKDVLDKIKNEFQKAIT